MTSLRNHTILFSLSQFWPIIYIIYYKYITHGIHYIYTHVCIHNTLYMCTLHILQYIYNVYIKYILQTFFPCVAPVSSLTITVEAAHFLFVPKCYPGKVTGILLVFIVAFPMVISEFISSFTYGIISSSYMDYLWISRKFLWGVQQNFSNTIFNHVDIYFSFVGKILNVLEEKVGN